MNKRISKLMLRSIILIISILSLVYVSKTHMSASHQPDPTAVHALRTNSSHSITMLVNQQNPLPSNYSVPLSQIDDTHSIDSRIVLNYNQLVDAAQKEGIYLKISSSYRSKEEQTKLYNDTISNYMKQGYSKQEATKRTEREVAIPGTSEHELGLALDLNGDKKTTSNSEAYEWLANNAYKYGFILRYPADKTEITGIKYEPWHYRFVGTELANQLYINKICLEEYYFLTDV